MTGKTSEVEFIVLSTTKVGESALVLHTLSKQYGRHSFITRIQKSTSMYLPLSILNAQITESTKTDLWRAGSISAEYPLSGTRANIHKNTITLFLSEVLYRSLRDGVNEDGLYEWCRKMILTLDSLESDYASFHLRFLLDYTSILGFKADREGLAPFAGEYLDDLSRMINMDFSEFLLYPLDGKRRNDMAGIILQYLSYHLDCRLDIQSLRVLRELYA